MGTIDYRVTVDGTLRHLSPYARCLRDEEAVPSFFTGGVALDLSFSFADSLKSQNH
ncbi:hypothetical protein [Rhizobium sp.]|jgi:hypothetical protein|uniref:hypothetical protein n=1 Tax=Rhizobium sp. TaxID=391 RepID=UPI0028AFD1E5